MAQRCTATILALLMIVGIGKMTNTPNGSLQLFHILMDYGMRVFHAGKDFFELKNPIRMARVELQKVRIFNLKSVYDSSLPEVKALPVEESKTEEWK
ncbi:hypothetical protein TcWFU_002561 [Taenia crassiceps]|uniref:Uncharacterized protein n=1 Tax=Taenia crassiceps TaxID=6207 RepID=A0ABR4PZ42_9CEST